jgi:hypothetical protein
MLPAFLGHPGAPVRWHVRSFFTRDPVTFEKAPKGTFSKNQTPIGQSTAQLLYRCVRACRIQSQNLFTISLNLMRAPVSTARLRPRIALILHQSAPAAHARRRHTKPSPRNTMRGTLRNKSQNTIPQIKRQSSHIQASQNKRLESQQN